MHKLVFTDSAQMDLESIYDSTAEHWNTNQAKNYLHHLHDLLITLTENQKIGLVRDSLGENVQSFPFKSHHIFYFCTNDTLNILRILHSSRDPVRHLI